MHQHFRPLQLRADETRQSETSRQTIPYKRFSLPKRKEKFFFGARCRFPLPETIKLGPTLHRLKSNKSLKKVIFLETQLSTNKFSTHNKNVWDFSKLMT